MTRAIFNILVTLTEWQLAFLFFCLSLGFWYDVPREDAYLLSLRVTVVQRDIKEAFHDFQPIYKQLMRLQILAIGAMETSVKTHL